ncbi:hypothetical protein DFH09DRAFT_1084464 [Mycena vulgaris]|nr:hypothetical protein DFH09DRAFT_1084464 [Mycena vulgaris]
MSCDLRRLRRTKFKTRKVTRKLVAILVVQMQPKYLGLGSGYRENYSACGVPPQVEAGRKEMLTGWGILGARGKAVACTWGVGGSVGKPWPREVVGRGGAEERGDQWTNNARQLSELRRSRFDVTIYGLICGDHSQKL